MTAPKKDFMYYFKRNLIETPGIKYLPTGIPESIGATSTTVFASLGAMSAYAIHFGSKATVEEMIKTLPGGLRYVAVAGAAVEAGSVVFIDEV